ncbi:glycosyltransferase [Oceanicella actignis]|uniref:Glycosyl transferase family 2 n=1 Tax=Oceanicella actignis TaxID=1189325 RepID=A0A1M7T5A8_9RHOB|nr:glycosyltransferase [Oceanicella actignis]TYO83957.1 glycosyl transferase family 2 [Oceanicella actignis]SET42919.1 Glycosyl transferase family 2 [Oceanicella actignis]SHN65876.1 Glycosyl transferase family 2 [Oceanicella actignis]
MPSGTEARVPAVIIPACNEEAWIGPCLDSLLAQRGAPPCVVVVAANGCNDATAQRARDRMQSFQAKGWRLLVLELPEGGKPNALNQAEAAAAALGADGARIYLDADVTCAPDLMAKLCAALATPEPRYATGRIQVAPARSWVTRRYAQLWTRLPFVRSGAVGAGLFAVNPAGRRRWLAFPPVISDDTFVRVLFARHERVEVDAPYLWPMVEGFGALVRVRRRQDAGVAQIHAGLPDAARNEGKSPLGLGGALRLFAQAPTAFCVYAAVSAAVRLSALAQPGAGDWARGR